MEKTDKKETVKKITAELADLLAGAAFPFILMLILSSLIISYASYGEERGLAIAAVVLGDLMLAVAYVIFGKQNGVTAYCKTVQQAKKRELGTDDFKARRGVGEYALWKGFAIGLLSCVPFLIFQIIDGAAPNTVCEFVLCYAFGWAYYPFSFAGLSEWLNLLCVVPLACVHAGAYAYGGYRERLRQNKIAEAENLKGKKNRK